jgi:hypothetical protein
MNTVNQTNTSGPSIGFVRATIKIAHPDWSPEQIESELQMKLQELQKQNDGGDCEFCSS